MPEPKNLTAEEKRLQETKEHRAHWRRWGPYLSERQWGTVREDYSPGGTCWEYFPHEHARSRAYRWGEDGLAGISDNHQRLCFALALWNEEDPFLKERLFGLTGNEGNHGEDVKEYYYYLDNTPTHSYMKCLYKYPHRAFPYSQLAEENRRRGRNAPEFELIDTGIFSEDGYFDVFVEYAKETSDDLLIQIEIVNRGPETKKIHLLPTLWFRNTWSWKNSGSKPSLKVLKKDASSAVIEASEPTLGKRWFVCEGPQDLLFTENETNYKKLFATDSASRFFKDGINDYVVSGKKDSVNPSLSGTKFSPHYCFAVEPGKSRTVRLRLTDSPEQNSVRAADFENVFSARRKEADEFYAALAPSSLSKDLAHIQRQAFAGMLWSKQFYHYVIEDWLNGDPAMPQPPPERKRGRNHEWKHFYNDDILSMPDKWEYPWFAAWDLAFHLIPLAMIDPEFAKNQLILLTREWYMHPNGQIPAYEWAFGDVNPPVHAWAALRIFKIEKKTRGTQDIEFLERVFQKLLLNFTWWVNRKDAAGKNIFQGGFLGLDNIGVFNRSAELPTGGYIEQSDGTSWMGMYCLNMLAIAMELARHNPVYEDIASKFFEHFLYIAEAMNQLGDGAGLWDEEDGFYYDKLRLPDGRALPMKLRSVVGLIPLFAITVIEPEDLEKFPGFKKRLLWFIKNRPDLSDNIASMEARGSGERRLLSIVDPAKLKRILQKMLDESEFLGPYGIRSISRHHASHPYTLKVDGQQFRVDYEPAESSSGLFGGNSNWRGPVWFPINFLIVESLQKFHYYLGNDFKVECPTGSGKSLTLWEAAVEISHRLTAAFTRAPDGRRPFNGGVDKFQTDPHWKDHLLFYEYFHGDNGAGIGASHQTGWTGIVAKLIQQCGEHCNHEKGTSLPEKNRSSQKAEFSTKGKKQ